MFKINRLGENRSARGEPVIDVVDAPRRRLLRDALFAAPAVVFASRSAHAARESTPSRSLSFLNTHTHESLSVDYFAAGQYRRGPLAQLDQLLRDHRSGEVGHIDPKLFDQLHELALRAGADPRFEVISGFRSAASNALLHSQSSGVAQHSMHLFGRAIDVRLSGIRTAQLHELALGLKGGGVGYYAKSDFVHLDTGGIRSWIG